MESMIRRPLPVEHSPQIINQDFWLLPRSKVTPLVMLLLEHHIAKLLIPEAWSGEELPREV